MSWRDRVQPASFRGVVFQAETGSEPVGRQTQVHEYPQRDEPMVEDLGRATRPIKLIAWLAGPDAFERRDELLKALDEPGPGELVHPWMGPITVTATDCEMEHDRREGGVVRFDLVFVVGGELAYPSTHINTAAMTSLAAADVEETAVSRFEEAMGAVDMARAQLRNVQGVMQDVIAQITNVPLLQDVLDAVQDVQAVYEQIRSVPAEFARTLFNAVGTFQRTFEGFGSLVSGSFISLPGINSQARAIERIGQITQPADQESAAFGAAYVGLIQDVLLVSALSDVAQVPAAMPPVAVGGVPTIEARSETEQTDTTNAWLLSEMLLAGNGRAVPVAEDVRATALAVSGAVWAISAGAAVAHFESLAAARIRAGQHLAAVARAGVQVITVEPTDVTPALVLAYRLYEDAGRAGELLARNRIAHPGFVPVKPLEVAQP